MPPEVIALINADEQIFHSDIDEWNKASQVLICAKITWCA